MSLPKAFAWARIYRPYLAQIRRRAVLGCIASALGAACEAMGLAVLGIAASHQSGRLPHAGLTVAAIGASLVLGAGARALSDSMFARGQVELETRLRSQITDAMLRCDWQDFAHYDGHELQAAVTSETIEVAQAVTAFIRGCAWLTGGAVMYASTFFVSIPAASVCAVFAVAMIVIYLRATRGYRGVQERLAEGGAEITRSTMVLVGGMRSLRLAPIQEAWRTRLQGVYETFEVARGRHFAVPIRGRLVVESLTGVMVFAILIVQLLTSGTLLSGLVVMALILRVLPRVQVAQQQLSFAQHGVSWPQRWELRMAALTAASQSEPEPAAVAQTSLHLSRVRPDHAADPDSVVTMRNLRFSYRGHARPVLDGVDLDIHRGEWVSLRGESGQGKTTLIDLIGGILRPTGGDLLLNGIPASAYSNAEYYRLVAVVPQEVYLTGSTVDEIVTWDGHLSDANPAVYTRAMGVDTMFAFSSLANGEVDELGRDLSGGMRVRLAMARALAGGPSLLVLDETTSRLHVEAEAEIFTRLKTLRPDLALLLVTHRADSLRFVDRQLRLTDGHVEEEQRCQSA